jgi:CheY-like chemotaxis protein
MTHLFEPGAIGAPREVVFVGGDHEDAFLFEEALIGTGSGIAVHCQDAASFRQYMGEKLSNGALHGIAAVIVDLALPGAHGVKLLRELQQDGPTQRLPVFALSAFGTSTVQGTEASHVWPKPSDLAGFEQLVSGVDRFEAA